MGYGSFRYVRPPKSKLSAREQEKAIVEDNIRRTELKKKAKAEEKMQRMERARRIRIKR